MSGYSPRTAEYYSLRPQVGYVLLAFSSLQASLKNRFGHDTQLVSERLNMLLAFSSLQVSFLNLLAFESSTS